MANTSPFGIEPKNDKGWFGSEDLEFWLYTELNHSQRANLLSLKLDNDDIQQNWLVKNAKINGD